MARGRERVTIACLVRHVRGHSIFAQRIFDAKFERQHGSPYDDIVYISLRASPAVILNVKCHILPPSLEQG